MAGPVAGRTLTILLTLALFAAGSSFARMRAVAGPANETPTVRIAEALPLSAASGNAPVRHWPFGYLSDEAVMALVGTALLAVAAALKKAP